MPSAMVMIFAEVRILPFWHLIESMHAMSAVKYLDTNNVAGFKNALSIADSNNLSPIFDSLFYSWSVDYQGVADVAWSAENDTFLNQDNNNSAARTLQDDNNSGYGFPNYLGKSNRLIFNCLGLITV